MVWMARFITQIYAVMFSFVIIQRNAQYVVRQVRRVLICVTVSLRAGTTTQHLNNLPCMTPFVG